MSTEYCRRHIYLKFSLIQAPHLPEVLLDTGAHVAESIGVTFGHGLAGRRRHLDHLSGGALLALGVGRQAVQQARQRYARLTTE